ncbi:MAG TPA: GNAT family N-acetyltransferase [Candidatus Cloacimonas sp.]|nr:GNAT family N-acetyltransferase [Candidatus Cloacimonas sp.]HCX60498.1 GNAT family N-acetyltransferase [Candidatus Cloacimonas sp.]
MPILSYDSKRDESGLMQLLQEEGEDWSCYFAPHRWGNYCRALAESIVYVAYESEKLCGFCRALKDGEFYIYVCELLVGREHRGNSLGQMLLKRIETDFSDHDVYVMSDADGYYEKIGYKKEGTIYRVK